MSNLAPNNKVCGHGLTAADPDMVLSPAAFMKLPLDIRLAVAVCADCAKLILRGRDDDASQSLQQRAWYALTATPLAREPLSAEQREELAAMVAAGQASL